MKYILRLQCHDRKGIVAAVSGCLSANDCNIEEASQFNDQFSGQFFMRVLFSTPDISKLQQSFPALAQEFSMAYGISPEKEKIKTLILVSQADHCLNDILYRWRTNHLDIDIKAVFSNNEKNRALVESQNLQFNYSNHADKQAHEENLENLIEETDAELIVLARYMQVLSDKLSQKYAGRIINIHHSFLPGFKGAKPYHQAWERGVKITGATAHFVTADLDEGPIIEQETVRISHADTPEKMQVIGKDTESRVLARAIQLYTERRIFLHDNRTVIL
ncbi:MAG: formyltetrahydrofolate deformylase [Micavibrio aeruginosavorus]|uniref:Formyltetrahydrofolate deformylase n=1 Tax=Micavibrio aeruginosavorus TaxID=349221 RepID=A0A2W5HBY2_9BACT|nr:MAG: formyltetrahydrofolate deformylase [Micavibrio aeruginosavorus]